MGCLNLLLVMAAVGIFVKLTGSKPRAMNRLDHGTDRRWVRGVQARVPVSRSSLTASTGSGSPKNRSSA